MGTLNLFASDIVNRVSAVAQEISTLDTHQKIEAINAIKRVLHSLSPMRNEPVDCVIWVPADTVTANDYNPNVVAPPEMKLLERSIEADGYTQPIVVTPERETVDGFHRGLVGKNSKMIRSRCHGYLPVTIIRPDQEGRMDRIASTIRHNRARGKHQVQQMSEIVMELYRRNWSDEKIAKELGMEPDEVLRLKQITGLAEMFADRDFSEAWEVG